MIYNFSIRDADGRVLEAIGCISLPSDVGAEDFGDAVIRDMVLGNPAPHPGGMKREVFNRLQEHLSRLADEVERAMMS